MKTHPIKTLFIGLAAMLMVSVAQAKCYPGLDCPDDLPNTEDTRPEPAPSPRSSGDDWQMLDRYQVKGGLVKDLTTGLMWMRCSFGQTWDGSTCTGKAAEVTWEQAMNIPKHFDYAGYSDWRVPSFKELTSLVYCSSGSIMDTSFYCNGDYDHPTIVSAVFPNTPSQSWSSSPSSDPDDAVSVDFWDGGGRKSVRSGRTPVRLVRASQ